MPFVERLLPPLTTVRIDEYEIGLRAARCLLQLVEDPSAKRETIMIGPELVVRGSTAAAADAFDLLRPRLTAWERRP